MVDARPSSIMLCSKENREVLTRHRTHASKNGDNVYPFTCVVNYAARRPRRQYPPPSISMNTHIQQFNIRLKYTRAPPRIGTVIFIFSDARGVNAMML